MSQPPPHPTPAQHLASQANAWVLRLSSGTATVADASALREWCARSPQHAQAYREATRLWRLAGQLPRPRRRQRPWLLRSAVGAVAACLLLGVFGAMQIGLVPDARALLADHHTRLGERRQVELPDGSRVELDARTRLDVDFSAGQRHLRLGEGAAVFHVQKDADRPFVVSARGGTVTALGTVFEVRHQQDAIQVTCSEGVVEVRQGAAAQHRLQAGEQLRYGANSTTAVATVDSDQALAWRQGLLVFKGRPLQELVEELNRYRPGRILIADASKARMPVSGVFHLQRPDEALQHIEQSLHLTAVQWPAGVTLLR
ncbi:MAG: FecR family protein [Pseudomonas sp.]|uniref:FecR family protein n=1 Tax=Pseudomonas sp. TaxID=306 RepID=UPI003391E45C